MNRKWTVFWAVISAALALGLLFSGVRRTAQAAVDSVVVWGVWQGTEQAGFEQVLGAFTAQSGISATYQPYTDTPSLIFALEDCQNAGSCPDVAFSNINVVSELTAQGRLQPLDPILSNFDDVYSNTWRELASIDGILYALPFKVVGKSMIWYRPEAFTSTATSIPETWTELMAVADAMVSDGQTPFAIAAESGGASGWPLSDWFENILVRSAGPEVHRALVRHDISWTDPRVVEALELFGGIVSQEEYVVGGPSGIVQNNFFSVIEDTLGGSDAAAMFSLGNWIHGYIRDQYPTLTPVSDYNVFNFPEINPAYRKPMVGGVDLAFLMSSRPEAASLMQFLATPEAAETWIGQDSSFLTPNQTVDTTLYTDTIDRALAEQILGVQDFVYDLDDQLPSELQQFFWQALMDFVENPDAAATLETIEAKATELQGPPYQLFVPLTRRD